MLNSKNCKIVTCNDMVNRQESLFLREKSAEYGVEIAGLVRKLLNISWKAPNFVVNAEVHKEFAKVDVKSAKVRPIFAEVHN